ncbi:MAG: hypothetical protein QW103_01155 [Candidatus Pacearchaeota archaeon]
MEKEKIYSLKLEKILGIEKVESASLLLRFCPNYSFSMLFYETMKNCLYNYNFDIEALEKNSTIFLEGNKRRLVCTNADKFYLGYSKEPRKIILIMARAERLPQFKPDIILGRKKKKDLVPLELLLDNDIYLINYNYDIFGANWPKKMNQ